MEKVRYKKVFGDNEGRFEERVTELINDGWELQGGVSMLYLSNICYCQALTKKGHPETP